MDDQSSSPQQHASGRTYSQERRNAALVTWEQLLEWADRHEQGERLMFTSINAKMDTILLLLSGDGTDTRPGVILRLDRIEQDHKDASKLKDWLLKGALGAVGAWFATRYLN